MRRHAIPAILTAILFPSSFTGQAPEPQVGTTYGLGLPRDRETLFIPDRDYPNWPLRPDQMDYADVSGSRMKEWVRRISAISLQSQAAGNMYWGRLPGTEYDAMTMDLMLVELERLGLETERVPPHDTARLVTDLLGSLLYGAWPVCRTLDRVSGWSDRPNTGRRPHGRGRLGECRRRARLPGPGRRG